MQLIITFVHKSYLKIVQTSCSLRHYDTMFVEAVANSGSNQRNIQLISIHALLVGLRRRI